METTNIFSCQKPLVSCHFDRERVWRQCSQYVEGFTGRGLGPEDKLFRRIQQDPRKALRRWV